MQMSEQAALHRASPAKQYRAPQLNHWMVPALFPGLTIYKEISQLRYTDENHQFGVPRSRFGWMTTTATAPHRSLVGLDWFAFFVADIQTGWGPFVAAYLTSVAWTQFDIGLVLTIGTAAAFALQVPAGALVD